MAGKLNRLTSRPKCRQLIRTLSLLPFFHNQHQAIRSILDTYGYTEHDQCFKDPNIKLIMYVFQIYCIKYQAIFFIDLTKDIRRTNNSAEGSNSGLSKYKNNKMTLRDFADYCEVMWKRDLCKKVRNKKAINETDSFLLSVQKASRYNIYDLLLFILSCSPSDSFKIKNMIMPIPWLTRSTLVKNTEHILIVAADLELAKKRYKKFRLTKKVEWKN